MHERGGYPVNPDVELSHAEHGHAGQIAAGIPGNEHADGRGKRDAQSAGENPPDQNAADPDIAISVGVDRLELGVGHGGLGDWIDGLSDVPF